MALPTAATPGYGYYYTYTSHPDVACDCLRAWLPKLARLARQKGILGSSETLRIIQATGGAEASGNTHSLGGAVDTAFLDAPRWHDRYRRDYMILGPKTLALLVLMREMGAEATWARFDVDGRNDGDIWEGNPHLHSVLRGCPHNSRCRYQIDEYDRGEDGLTGSGRDLFPRPKVSRTWKQGIAWADVQLNPTTTTTKDWFDMATKADLQAVVRAELRDSAYLREVARYVLTGYTFDHDNDSSTPEAVLSYAIQNMPDQVWDEKAGDNPYTLDQHVLNANIKAGLALDLVRQMKGQLDAIQKKLGA